MDATRAISSGSGRRTRRPSSSSCARPMSHSSRRSPTRRSGSMTRAGCERTSTRSRRGPQAIVTEVNGTGPYRLEALERGHGGQPRAQRRPLGRSGEERAGHRPLEADSPQRVDELQAGTVDGIDEVDPTGVEAIDADVGMVNAARHGLVTSSTSASPTPWRRSTARPSGGRWPSGSTATASSRATCHRAPSWRPSPLRAPSRTRCTGTRWYDFDPTLAKETLAAAGFPEGFVTTLHFPESPEPRAPGPALARPRAPGRAPDQPRHHGRPRRRARRDLPRGSQRRHPRRHPPPDARAGLSGRERLARSALRGRSEQRDRPALRRHHEGAGRRSFHGQRGEARGRIREGQRRHPRPRRRSSRSRSVGSTAAFLPTSTERCLAAPPGAFATMTPGDRRSSSAGDPRTARPVLRRRDRRGGRAALRPGRREPLSPRAGRRRGHPVARTEVLARRAIRCSGHARSDRTCSTAMGSGSTPTTSS